jgi:hypothetical protein
VATRVLAALDIPLDPLRLRIEEALSPVEWPGGPIPPSSVTLSVDGRRALDLAWEEAVGHPHIGTEHLLLGLVGAGTVAALLDGLGVTRDRVRAEAERLLIAYARDWPMPPDGSAGDELVELRHVVLRLHLREYNEKIVDLRRQKRAAIRAREYDQAAALRLAERQLLEEKTRQAAHWAHGLDLGVLVDELDRMHQELDRLRTLLRDHNIPPDTPADPPA